MSIRGLVRPFVGPPLAGDDFVKINEKPTFRILEDLVLLVKQFLSQIFTCILASLELDLSVRLCEG